jgi:pilus assembly protein Flp/PilA
MSKNQKNNIKGATMIEYILIVGLISIAAVIIMGTLGGSIGTLFTTVNTSVSGA